MTAYIDITLGVQINTSSKYVTNDVASFQFQ